MVLEPVTSGITKRFDVLVAARERAIPASRRSIRCSANAIRAIHRLDFPAAEALMGEARQALEEGLEAADGQPEIRAAGYLHDAEKEYTESRVTYAIVRDEPIPGPEELGVGDAQWLNGMSEAIGEARRHILDLLRKGEVEQGERLLAAMDDLYSVLVSIDYPDAVTGNLRRSTDVARGILEKTRGDLTMSIVLDRHTNEVADR